MIRPLRTLFCVLAVSAAISSVPSFASADPAPAPAYKHLFDNTGVSCRNFGIIAPVDRAVARKIVPARYQVPTPALGLVELATCPKGSLKGKQTGSYTIAEAGVLMGAAPDQLPFPLGQLNLTMLWLLDSDPALAAAKQAAGYPGGVAPISFTPPTSGAVRSYTAKVGYDGGYSLQGTLLSLGLPIDQVTQQYTDTRRGTLRTTNSIYGTTETLAGTGTATFAPGSRLARLFGATKITGAAIAGTGSFRNTTVLAPPGTGLFTN